MEKENMGDFINHLSKNEIYDAREIIKTEMQDKINVKASEYIASGDALSDYINSDRYNESITESKIDYEDVATKMFKKFKGDINKIKTELEKTDANKKDINTIIGFVKKI